MSLFHLNISTVLGILKGEVQIHEVAFLKVLNTFASFGMWVVSAFLLIRIRNYDAFTTWQVKRPQPSKVLLVLPLVFMALLVVSAILIRFNYGLPLPQSIKDLNSAANQKLLENFLVMNNVNQLIANLFLMALAPALFEEIFFRGTVQRLLIHLFGNAHIGIAVCSFAFAAIHMNVMQFIPMFFLALVLGYVCHYTKSIWPSIILHFLNNAFAVLVNYYSTRMPMAKAMAEDNYTPSIAIIVVSILIIAGFFFWITKDNNHQSPPTHE